MSMMTRLTVMFFLHCRSDSREHGTGVCNCSLYIQTTFWPEGKKKRCQVPKESTLDIYFMVHTPVNQSYRSQLR